MRGAVYAYIAEKLNLPESQVHMAHQTDIEILRKIYSLAIRSSSLEIHQWASDRRKKNGKTI